MTLRAWRIDKAKRIATAFSGEGARLSGGRWNSPGTALVYTAEHPALAAMEVLVHLPADQLLLKQFYVLIPVEFDEVLVDESPLSGLPTDWAASPVPESAQRFGDRCAADPATRPVRRIPSAVVSGSWNFLINPLHPQFRELVILAPQPFEFDPRLIKR